MTHPHYVPYEFAKRHSVIICDISDKLTLNYIPPLSLNVLNEIQRKLSSTFATKAIDEETFSNLLNTYYKQKKINSHESKDWKKIFTDLSDIDVSDEATINQNNLLSESNSPIVRYINLILNEAIYLQASDIHVELFDTHLNVRARVDGALRHMNSPPKHLAKMIIARIKVMAELDIAEKRLPQDGRILLEQGTQKIDVRVSIVPTAHGERAVLRLLDQSSVELDLSQLGMNPSTLSKINSLLSQPHGIILVTGPTGSGKSTTLYAGINQINNAHCNILTVEDPVEYDVPGVGQIPVNTAIDMTFAKGLRAILRQDPDIIMIGEIRDYETAHVAVQASLTGHLVLSTLHTNTAIGAVTRLRDMGLESYHLSESIKGLISQRLLRKLCENCKEKQEVSIENLKETNLFQYLYQSDIYTSKGCNKCSNTGYNGRIAVFEIISQDATLQRLIHENSSEEQLISHVRKKHDSIITDAIQKVKQGITDLDEVQRVMGFNDN